MIGQGGYFKPFPLFCIEGTVQISDPPSGACNQRPRSVPAVHLFGGFTTSNINSKQYDFMWCDHQIRNMIYSIPSELSLVPNQEYFYAVHISS